MTHSRSTRAERSCHVFSAASGPRHRRHFLFLARSQGSNETLSLGRLAEAAIRAPEKIGQTPERLQAAWSVLPESAKQAVLDRIARAASSSRRARSARRKPIRCCRRIIARLGSQRRNRAHRSPNSSLAPIWRQGSNTGSPCCLRLTKSFRISNSSTTGTSVIAT